MSRQKHQIRVLPSTFQSIMDNEQTFLILTKDSPDVRKNDSIELIECDTGVDRDVRRRQLVHVMMVTSRGMVGEGCRVAGIAKVNENGYGISAAELDAEIVQSLRQWCVGHNVEVPWYLYDESPQTRPLYQTVRMILSWAYYTKAAP